MNQTGAVYNDFAGLANLKARAAQESPEATQEAARQFEALFVQMMLKSMREAGAVLGEERDTTYEEMFDQQVAVEMTRGRGIGIAEMLVRQLAPTTPAAAAAPAPFDAAAARYSGPDRDISPARADWRPDDPQQFVDDIWPLAEQAAQQLDIDPRTLVAQAALETGWGQKLIRDGAGVSGNNLFGIKADSRWDGERVTVSTLEYDGGVPRRMSAEFRAYPTLREGFADYVNFLQDNARYESATQGGLTPEDYAGSLQDAGYATDPRYADKIGDLVNGSRLNDLVTQVIRKSDQLAGESSALKIDTDEPIYL